MACLHLRVLLDHSCLEAFTAAAAGDGELPFQRRVAQSKL
jgi:hypothetical protein